MIDEPTAFIVHANDKKNAKINKLKKIIKTINFVMDNIFSLFKLKINIFLNGIFR